VLTVARAVQKNMTMDEPKQLSVDTAFWFPGCWIGGGSLILGPIMPMKLIPTFYFGLTVCFWPEILLYGPAFSWWPA
jgi:hypothetical protein